MSRPKKLPPVHPGEILLEEFLKPLGMSMNKLADELHMPANRVTQIVEGTRSITGETALRLARYFGTSPEFWLGMQKDYDLQVARDEFEAEVDRQVGRVRRQPKEIIRTVLWMWIHEKSMRPSLRSCISRCTTKTGHGRVSTGPR